MPSAGFTRRAANPDRGLPMTRTALFAAALLATLLPDALGETLRTAPVAAVSGERAYVAQAVVEAVRLSTIASQVPARIVELRVRAGDRVAAGQVLVRLDPRAAADQVVASQAQVAAAQAQLDAARKDYERNQRLFGKHYISQAAMDQAESQFKAAQAQSRAMIAQAGLATTQSSFTTLTAPYAGIVAGVSAERGDMASPGMPLLTLYDPAELRVVATVPETYVAQFAAGAPVRIELSGADGRPRTIDAAASVLLPTADPSTHTRQVRLALPRDAQGLAPGMFARASFPLTTTGPGRLTIPPAAVVRRPEFNAVYVVPAGGRPQLRQVRLGRETPAGVEVLAGLQAGETIALDPVAAARQ
jgi:RND family efflux transporter MFP subunit